MASSDGDDEAFIIGGGEIYAQSIDLANCLYITEVITDADADVFFPRIELRDWQGAFSRSYPQNDKDQFASWFKILVRKDTEFTGEIIARVNESILSKLTD